MRTTVMTKMDSLELPKYARLAGGEGENVCTWGILFDEREIERLARYGWRVEKIYLKPLTDKQAAGAAEYGDAVRVSTCCFGLLRREQELVGIVSFSDDCPSLTAAGEVVFAGHIGTIFQAANGRYLGRGTPRTLKLLPDARVFSDRTYQKIRVGERGWLYSARMLQSYGAEAIDQGAARAERMAWLAHWSKPSTRPLRHPGNHKYAWPFEKKDRRMPSVSLRYPKRRGLLRHGNRTSS